jgi:CBS domain-containing protein
MPESNRVPTAEEIMVRSLVTFRPDTTVSEAIATLLAKRISGGPVTDDEGRVVGFLSERDCLRVLSSDDFYAGDQQGLGLVDHLMTRECVTIAPDTDVYGIAHYFLTKGFRKLPVVSDGMLVGQVSRRDVLRLIDRMGEERTNRKHYPDYREPEKLFIAKGPGARGSSRAATRSVV